MGSYDLEERTAKFGEKVIRLLRKLFQDAINKRLISQCVASAGSIGANYCEANEAENQKDFEHKIAIAKKEIKETKHWLRLLNEANSNLTEDFLLLRKECQELLLIFSKILVSSRNSRKIKNLKINSKIENS